MTRGTSMLLAAMAGAVVAGTIVWFMRPSPAVQPVPTAPTAAAVAPATVQPAHRATVTSPTSAGATPPPWAATANAPPAPSGLAAAMQSAPANGAKRAELTAIRDRLRALTSNGRQPSIAEVDQVLGDLVRVQGNPVLAGINLQALRDNLAAVDEIQKVAARLQTETQRPGGGDKQTIQSLTARLQELQSHMRMDIRAPAAAASPRG